ncbi:hypothetical protein, partial [Prevotella bivia]|uniref:hypothetical protein n=1 Tax=Prevotella bivia TaxID=28125 RepID=UPI00056B602E
SIYNSVAELRIPTNYPIINKITAMRKKYIKPLCTVIHTEMDVAILQDSDIPLKPNDSILDIKEEKRVDDGEETVDWG